MRIGRCATNCCSGSGRALFPRAAVTSNRCDRKTIHFRNSAPRLIEGAECTSSISHPITERLITTVSMPRRSAASARRLALRCVVSRTRSWAPMTFRAPSKLTAPLTSACANLRLIVMIQSSDHSRSHSERMLRDSVAALRFAHKMIHLNYLHSLFSRRHYDPNQPRVPAGNPDGGQWTRVGGSAGHAPQAAASQPHTLAESDGSSDSIEPTTWPAELESRQSVGARRAFRPGGRPHPANEPA